MDAKQIGEVIKEPRKRKGMTKKELIIVPVTVKRYENGVVKKVVHVAEHERLALSSVINLSVISELLYENEEIVFTSEVVEVKESEKLLKAVNAELEEWLCSGDVDYLHKAMAVIRSKIEEDGVEDLVRIKVAPGNGVRVAKAVWNKENGKVYCDCCKESTLRYYNFCPNCGCYLLRDEN